MWLNNYGVSQLQLHKSYNSRFTDSKSQRSGDIRLFNIFCWGDRYLNSPNRTWDWNQLMALIDKLLEQCFPLYSAFDLKGVLSLFY